MSLNINHNKSRRELVPLLLLAVSACAQVSTTGPKIKAARLVNAVKDSRPNNRGGAYMTPPSGSVFLAVWVEITKADSLPLVLQLYNAQAKDSTTTYPAFGILPVNIDSDTVTVAFRPVGRGGGIADVTESASSGGDDSDFSLKNYGPETERSAKMIIKKVPSSFTLFFVVPAKTASFDVLNVAGRPLSTGELALPTSGQK